MQYTSAKQGRVFVIRLEHGDVLHDAVETVAVRESLTHGVCFAVGGADRSSRIVVGPEDGQADTIVPMVHQLADVFEMAGVGTIFPSESGHPTLHMHATFGRKEDAKTGCVRAGVDTWLIGEVVILELTDCAAVRRPDPDSGFELLSIPH